MKHIIHFFGFLVCIQVCACNGQSVAHSTVTQAIKTGAENTEAYFPIIRDKALGLVVNQTSRVGEHHLVDSLLLAGLNPVKILTLEHGFRGTADRGKEISNDRDSKTGLEIISLYGSKKKPSKEDLSRVDILIFDIQDVGVRFYTYISSLHYIMEACAEFDIPLIVLDRPNPNLSYIDGPVLEESFKSFVGMHPVPVIYGMTIGEYARMINGESWLQGKVKCTLHVIPCLNYTRSSEYVLPVKPSPNLPTMNAIAHYPGLCFFEATEISVGRGTNHPFECYGHPEWKDFYQFSFVPESVQGASAPLHEGRACYGEDLRNTTPKKKLDLTWLLNAYELCDKMEIPFITNERFFDLLAGTDSLRKQIMKGNGENALRIDWNQGIEDFKIKRKKYLIYRD